MLQDYINAVFNEIKDKIPFVDDGDVKFESPSNKEDYLVQNNRILGAPPGFIASSDPGDRFYNHVLMRRAPVIGIVPGVPNSSTETTLTGEERETLREMADLAANGDEEEASKKIAALVSTNPNKRGKSNLPALQFYEFKADYAQYYKYINLLLQVMSVAIERQSGSNTLRNRWFYRFSDEYDPGLGDRSMSFWVERSTSVTESSSNDYGESMLAQKSNENVVSQLAKELNFTTALSGQRNTESGGIANSVGNVASYIPFIGGAAQAAFQSAGTIASGARLNFPQVWQNSSYSKDINLNFKFTSPYGDPGSIFEYVYKPFVCLLAFSLPRMTSSPMGYASPFIIRIDSPGWFNVDMGAVTSFSFKKGGSDDLWSIDTLPLSIEVNMSVTDLLPALAMTRKVSRITSNPALHTFLLNIAGIRTSDPFESGEALAKIWAAGKSQYIDPDSYFDAGKNIVNDAVFNKAGEWGMQIGGIKSIFGL